MASLRFEQAVRQHFRVIRTSGKEIQCLCPWHEDRTGHLYVNGNNGLYLCMVCGSKGSLGKQVKPPPLEVQQLRERWEAALAPAGRPRHYPETWLSQFDMPCDYWTQVRGLSDESVERFKLGYDPFSDRCTIPLRDVSGNILGVSYRRLDDGRPRYLDPKNYPKGKHLFGAWLLTQERTVALVEGPMDAVRCWESRVPAVATMGSRVTRDQVRLLKELGMHQVVVLYDNDEAGRKGTAAVWETLRGNGIRVSAGWYRPYWTEWNERSQRLKPIKDPDGLTPQRLRKMYHSATDIVAWAEHTGY